MLFKRSLKQYQAMKIGVVIHKSLREKLFNPQARKRLESMAEVVWTDSNTPLKKDGAIELLKDCELGIGSWNTPWPGNEILDNCPELRFWIHAAGSVKHMFDDKSAANRPIQIASCRGAIADLVAELVIGEMIIGLRKIIPNAESNKNGKTPKPEQLKTLLGSSVGVIGGSEVGKRVIRLLRNFHCTIDLYDPFISQEQAEDLGVTLRPSLTELCARNDVITLHTPYLPATDKLLKSEHFKAMQDSAVFINSSRGGCIDEPSLISELQKGRLFAFIDVTNPEPAADDSPLRKLSNVILTSHLAGPQSFHIGNYAVKSVEDFLSGKDPLDLIRREMLETIA